MFSLHESTRTLICRAAFLVLCAVPTCFVVGWCLYVNTSAFTRVHQQAIEARLGWKARLARASTPRPDLLLYEGLDLLDPTTGQLLARLPAVEVQHSGDAIAIRLPMPTTINGQRLAEFWQLLLAQLREELDWRHLQFEARNLTLHLAQGAESFTNVTGRVEGDENVRRLACSFNRATGGEPRSARAELTAKREFSSAPPITTVNFDTGSTPLPCDVFSGGWSAVSRLGRASTVQGRLKAFEQSGIWHAEFHGQLCEVDLDLLLRTFPHKLTGAAKIDIEAASVRGGRLESAAGTLLAGPGTVSRSLVHAAVSSLGLAASPQAMVGPGNHLAYQRMTLQFEIGRDGLILHGATTEQPGTILVGKQHVLLSEPASQPQPVLNLVRMLVPQTAVQVPATRETDALTRILPIPGFGVPPGKEETLPNARSLRVGPRK